MLCQLAALSSLQASLGTLLSHKPDFTPRMGYLWPVATTKATAEDSETSSGKSQGVDAEPSAPSEAVVATKRKKVTAKKQENATLLFNAMRTTAAQTQSQIPPHLPTVLGVSVSNDSQPAHSSSTPRPLSEEIGRAHV